MNDDELEAYLRKHTLAGQMQEVHDRGADLAHLVAQRSGFLWLVNALNHFLEQLSERWHEHE